jgi:hypothetical protein
MLIVSKIKLEWNKTFTILVFASSRIYEIDIQIEIWLHANVYFRVKIEEKIFQR